jgi:hypothetical protein
LCPYAFLPWRSCPYSHVGKLKEPCNGFDMNVHIEPCSDSGYDHAFDKECGIRKSHGKAVKPSGFLHVTDGNLRNPIKSTTQR